MRHAEILGLRPPGSNPCRGLRRRKTGFKAHNLTQEECRRLGRALRRAQKVDPVAVAVIRFLALTGARKSEARLLTWDMIDGPRAALPDSKTGPRAIWLGQPVRELLANLPFTATFVFSVGDGAITASALDSLWRCEPAPPSTSAP